jgi:hypothetical protein
MKNVILYFLCAAFIASCGTSTPTEVEAVVVDSLFVDTVSIDTTEVDTAVVDTVKQ